MKMVACIVCGFISVQTILVEVVCVYRICAVSAKKELLLNQLNVSFCVFIPVCRVSHLCYQGLLLFLDCYIGISCCCCLPFYIDSGRDQVRG